MMSRLVRPRQRTSPQLSPPERPGRLPGRPLGSAGPPDVTSAIALSAKKRGPGPWGARPPARCQAARHRTRSTLPPRWFPCQHAGRALTRKAHGWPALSPQAKNAPATRQPRPRPSPCDTPAPARQRPRRARPRELGGGQAGDRAVHFGRAQQVRRPARGITTIAGGLPQRLRPRADAVANLTAARRRFRFPAHNHPAGRHGACGHQCTQKAGRRAGPAVRYLPFLRSLCPSAATGSSSGPFGGHARSRAVVRGCRFCCMSRWGHGSGESGRDAGAVR